MMIKILLVHQTQYQKMHHLLISVIIASGTTFVGIGNFKSSSNEFSAKKIF